MRLLVLGGTGFVGRHIVEGALARGDDVTLFNRGRTAPGLFPAAELLCGDRAGDLGALRDGGPWDAAIDVTGYRPQEVAASSRLLADRVGHLTFISTISVYDDVSRAGVDEEAALAPLTGAGGWEDYGALKALCERDVRAALGERALIVRPGIVAGPHDLTNRFSARVARAARGGRMLAPGAPERPIQLIDARDLAAFVLDLTAAQTTGTFNAVGADLTWSEMLGACIAPGSDTELVWLSDERLDAEGVDEEALPLWITVDDADNAGFMLISGARAVAAGLRHRPVAETARDVRATLRPEDRTGLDPAREARIVHWRRLGPMAYELHRYEERDRRWGRSGHGVSRDERVNARRMGTPPPVVSALVHACGERATTLAANGSRSSRVHARTWNIDTRARPLDRHRRFSMRYVVDRHDHPGSRPGCRCSMCHAERPARAGPALPSPKPARWHVAPAGRLPRRRQQ